MTERKLVRFFWVLFLVSLPVTSFPWLPGVVGGSATVRPLAIYPLVPLAVYLLWRRFFREKLPAAFLPLFLFAITAAVSGVLAAVTPVPEFRGVTALDRVIRNMLTLGLGLGFYLAAALLPRSREDMRTAVRWLLIGFTAALVWSTLQAPYVLNMRANPDLWEPYFDVLNDLHHWISTRNLQEQRITGMAYEPSWYAEQLVILVLPWLLTGVMRRETVFRRRLRAFIIEDALLAWTTIILVLTYSRTGLVIFSIMGGVTILLGTGREPAGDDGRLARLFGRGALAQRFGVLAVAAVLMGVVVFSLGSQNRYFSRLWRYFTDEDAGGSYLTYIAFGQRFVYWEAALNMFEEKPVLGTGVGTFALHFEDAMPYVPLYQYPEILDLIVPEKGVTQLVTPKNLFLKTLAETGLVGFVFFVGFWLVVIGNTLELLLEHRGDEAYYGWGRAGLLGLLAAFLVAFSTDSYAMPNTWVLMGLMTAAARVMHGAYQETEAPVQATRQTTLSPDSSRL